MKDKAKDIAIVVLLVVSSVGLTGLYFSGRVSRLEQKIEKTENFLREIPFSNNAVDFLRGVGYNLQYAQQQKPQQPVGEGQ